MELQGQVALVTGAASGIGRATAERFAREGARVALLDRDAEALDALGRSLGAEGAEALALPADLTDPDAVRAAVETLDARWGRLDVVFANAGINGTLAPITELEPEDWRRTIDVNLNGTFYTLRYTVPLLERQGGAIVITSSINGTRRFTNPGASAYAATKAAQLALGQMLALELARHRIRVNVICPGAIDTQIDESTDGRDRDAAAYPVAYPAGEVPLTGGEPGTAEQVAELVLFLCSPRAAHVTGTPVWIDGAQSLLQG